jgi:hypothetical protein
MARLTIIDGVLFEIFATTRIQYQFIENEKINLLIHLQDYYNNPKVQFKITLDPDAEKETVRPEATLTLRDQYLKMVSLYPIIGEMRDRLKLDLDY